jgi:hypothetical protein
MGLKVVRHMPWGALSGFPRVLGHDSREYVLGTLWWFYLWPSVPIHTIHADTDNITIYIVYIHIHAYTYPYTHSLSVIGYDRPHNLQRPITVAD